jgi:hypothetical protein
MNRYHSNEWNDMKNEAVRLVTVRQRCACCRNYVSRLALGVEPTSSRDCLVFQRALPIGCMRGALSMDKDMETVGGSAYRASFGEDACNL